MTIQFVFLSRKLDQCLRALALEHREIVEKITQEELDQTEAIPERYGKQGIEKKVFYFLIKNNV